jgi:ribosome biogenesis GTPase
MQLEDLGYNDQFEQYRKELGLIDFEVGRVIAEHKERYIVKTVDTEYDSEITGNLRFSARSREDFPAVGDWVALSVYDSEMAIIHRVLPRLSMISRQAVGQSGEIQIIATNIDYAFLLQAVDRDFNINRIERYLTLCYAAKVEPVIVLTKTDLVSDEELTLISRSIQGRVKNVPLLTISNETREGYRTLESMIEKGKTYCMLGSSGVGKSTLLNNLSGKEVMKTDAISGHSQRGRHVTSHREMVLLDKGGILIDNPGMREVGIADTGKGLETTYDSIISYAVDCKFKDCTHTTETGCAVLLALENGDLDPDSYDNYLKIEKEKAHFEASQLERRKKDKDLAKILKNYKKDKNRKEKG